MTAASRTLDAVLDHYERLATDPAADARLRRAPLTTVEREQLAGIPALAGRKSLSPATTARETGVCLRASMNLDTTFGRHLLLPHPISEPGAQAGPGARPVGTIARLGADHLKLTYRLSGDLEALQASRAAVRRCAPTDCGGTAVSKPSSATPARATTGNTIFRRRAPGRPITSPATAKAWRRC